MPDMSAARRFARRLLALVRHAREEAELAREVQAHLALLADQFERQGVSPDEALRAARRAFGGVEQAKERQRDARGFRWVDDLHRDLRYAWRNLSRSPLFAVMAV